MVRSLFFCVPGKDLLRYTGINFSGSSGMMLAMGILKMTNRSDYWRQTKRLYVTQFGKFMPRDRYMIIWRYLHLSDNAAAQVGNPDKLVKLRPMIDHLNTAFRANYTPYRFVLRHIFFT